MKLSEGDVVNGPHGGRMPEAPNQTQNMNFLERMNAQTGGGHNMNPGDYTPGNGGSAHEIFGISNSPAGRLFAHTPMPKHIEANGVNETGRTPIGSA